MQPIDNAAIKCGKAIETMDTRQDIKSRKDYKFFHEISSRWNDNDVRWHINNAIYYEFFDTIINKMLLELRALDLQEGKQYFVAAETGCNYFEEIVFPDQVTAGLKIKHLGNSSVQYDIGLFKNQNQKTSARGHFVHILVDKNNMRPVDIPTEIRKELKEYL